MFPCNMIYEPCFFSPPPSPSPHATQSFPPRNRSIHHLALPRVKTDGSLPHNLVHLSPLQGGVMAQPSRVEENNHRGSESTVRSSYVGYNGPNLPFSITLTVLCRYLAGSGQPPRKPRQFGDCGPSGLLTERDRHIRKAPSTDKCKNTAAEHQPQSLASRNYISAPYTMMTIFESSTPGGFKYATP